MKDRGQGRADMKVLLINVHKHRHFFLALASKMAERTRNPEKLRCAEEAHHFFPPHPKFTNIYTYIYYTALCRARAAAVAETRCICEINRRALDRVPRKLGKHKRNLNICTRLKKSADLYHHKHKSSCSSLPFWWMCVCVYAELFATCTLPKQHVHSIGWKWNGKNTVNTYLQLFPLAARPMRKRDFVSTKVPCRAHTHTHAKQPFHFAAWTCFVVFDYKTFQSIHIDAYPCAKWIIARPFSCGWLRNKSNTHRYGSCHDVSTLWLPVRVHVSLN